MAGRDIKVKRLMFLVSYTLYFSLRITMSFFGDPSRGMAAMDSKSGLAGRLSFLNNITLLLFWSTCLMLYVSIYGRRLFWSRPKRFLITGIIVWLVWGTYVSFTGLSLFSGWQGIKAVIILGIFTTALIMASTIVEVYDLRKELAGITAFVLGTALLGGYITHFNGLEFLDSIGNILAKEDRYRVSFGFNHVNGSGKASLDFFMYFAIYLALMKERRQQHHVLAGGGNKD